MKKIIVVCSYIILFWVILPWILLTMANYLDKTWVMGFPVTRAHLSTGTMIMIVSVTMLLRSIYVFRTFGGQLPVSATPPATLIQRGVYAVWRHPIYLYYTTLFLGLGLVSGSAGLLTVVLPTFILLEGVYIFFEEKALVDRFGDTYRNYRRRTALIIPRLPYLLRIPARLLAKVLFSYQVHHQDRIPVQPPFLVVASHRNYLDPVFIALALPFPIAFITTYEVFRKPLSGFIFRKLLGIPRKRYLNDLVSIRRLYRAVREQSIIGIFPEGERSWTGITGPFKEETLKFITKFPQLPILPVRLEGNYQAWPRWGQNIRRAKVEVAIQEPLYHNPAHNLEQLASRLYELVTPRDTTIVSPTGNLANNISLVIYRCPLCRSFETVGIVGPSNFQCSACGKLFVVLPDYSIQYYDGQSSVITTIAKLYGRIKVKEDDILPQLDSGDLDDSGSAEEKYLVAQCPEGVLYAENGNVLAKLYSATIRLTNQYLYCRAGLEETRIQLNRIKSVTIESNSKLQVYEGKQELLYQLKFPNESALKWQDYLVEMIAHEYGYRPNTS